MQGWPLTVLFLLGVVWAQQCMSPQISRCRFRYIQRSPNLESKCLPVANRRAARFCENTNQLGWCRWRSVVFRWRSDWFYPALQNNSIMWMVARTYLTGTTFKYFLSIYIMAIYLTSFFAMSPSESKGNIWATVSSGQKEWIVAVLLFCVVCLQKKKRKLHMNSMM